MKFKNPIIPGYNPDPSVCRVGEDYYIVNSSFEYFPGVPVYHSRNLINWELIGYCLTEKKQIPLDKCRSSGGIYAPTLRYSDGIFYMTTTNLADKGNFIVYTKDLGNGWSEPCWVDQGGIDPSLFFDDDGKVYFTSTGMDEQGQQGIYQCEIDPVTGKRLTESVLISYGCGGKCPEGPHLYKWFGKYYLMLAEGGTEYGHMETLQRGDGPYGPFEPCPHNPVLSHKDDKTGEIHCTGHGDMIQDHNGNWWMVCLGVRTCSDSKNSLMMHNLGRETFLSPVVWNADGWPVVGDNGVLSIRMEGELPGEAVSPVNLDFYDPFIKKNLDIHYNYLRNPLMENYILQPSKSRLLLKGTEVTLNDTDSPTWLGIRQQGFRIEAVVEVVPVECRDGMRLGLAAFYNDSYHYEIYAAQRNGRLCVGMAKHIHDIFVETECREIEEGKKLVLKISSDKKKYSFFYSQDGISFQLLGTGLTVGLCTENTKSMTFTGTYIAMFAERGTGAFSDFSVRVLDD